MSWLTDVFTKIRGAPPSERIFARDIPVSGTAPAWHGQDIEPDLCYVELYVDSLRISRARSFATRFHGLVYSFASLSREGEARADYAAVSKPAKLADLDKSSLDKVITVSRRMMGAAPWRGGAMNLELGLFSVKSGNLLSPLLDYVGRVSSVAGISFVESIRPFLPLITEGMDMIAGQQGDTEVEVAVDTSLDLKKSGYYAMIDAPKGSLDMAKVKVDADSRLIYNDKPLDHAYCVFSIRATTQNPDYGEIPELRERWAALKAAMRTGKLQEAKDALTTFRLVMLTSPDLIPADARLLVKKASAQVDELFTGGLAGKAERSIDPSDDPRSLDLYGG